PTCLPRSSRARSARIRQSVESMPLSGAARPRTHESSVCSSGSTRPRRVAPPRWTWFAPEATNEPSGPLTDPRRSREAGHREPDADLHLVRRADRAGDQPPEMDLVDVLGVREVPAQAQGLRLQLQVDHALVVG